jgi:hypothetical protein
MPQVRYVGSNAENWLEVKPDDGGKNLSLPFGLKVSFLSREQGRDKFVVLEGVNKGKHCSVSVKSPTTSYLVTGLTHLPAGLVTFDLKSQSLKFGGQGPFNAFSGGGALGYTPVAVGSYKLAIPAFPSAQTRVQYARWTRFHRSWFRIGIELTGSRFLHPGQISEGCVTVRAFPFDGQSGQGLPQGFDDLSTFAAGEMKGLVGVPGPSNPAPIMRYDDLYRYLILRRDGDQSVGRLIVTNGGRH